MTASSQAIENTVATFIAEVGDGDIVCGALNGYGIFGWKMEAGDFPFPDEMQGGLDYGIAYLKHMAGQGFKVGFAVWKHPTRTLVCLKTWEPGEDEPDWPMDTSSATVTYHQ